MGERCEFCESTNTGPEARTPYGICPGCACTMCQGFRCFDDRGTIYSGSWPALFFTHCGACNGEGTRRAQQTGKDGEGT